MKYEEFENHREIVDWLHRLGFAPQYALGIVSYAIQTSLSIPESFTVLESELIKNEQATKQEMKEDG